jgi:predicted nucleic acid-binding protein
MLLDTSGLLCLLNDADPKHSASVAHYSRATILVTHSLVVSELVALATSRRLRRSKVLIYISDMLSNPRVDCIWADEPLMRNGLQLLEVRADKKYSLCDAVSFLIMRDRGIMDALT